MLVHRLLPPLLASALFLVAPTARAADDPAPAEDPPPGLRGPRIGFTPGIGVGFAAFTGNTSFPSLVFTTAAQIEALFEVTRWGFFLRGGFLSSGASGRWTAPTFALGTQYRLAGDGEERWGIVARAGVIYERWTANAQGCDVYYVIPHSCQNFVEPPAGGAPATAPASITADAVGALAGLRLEVPVEPVYVAFDAELSAAADVDQPVPGAAITGQIVVSFALRDHPIAKKGPREFRRPRFRY